MLEDDLLPLPTLPEVLDGLDGVAYFVDPEGRLTAFGTRQWKDFAECNGAADLADCRRLIGRPLLDMVRGDTVRRSYKDIFRTLSSGDREAVRFEFRCDAPDVERRMRMSVSTIRHGQQMAGFLFQSLILREDSRPPVDIFDASVLRAEVADGANLPIVRMCSFCQQVSTASDEQSSEWVEPKVYYQMGGDGKVRISHAICPTCREERIEPLIG